MELQRHILRRGQERCQGTYTVHRYISLNYQNKSGQGLIRANRLDFLASKRILKKPPQVIISTEINGRTIAQSIATTEESVPDGPSPGKAGLKYELKPKDKMSSEQRQNFTMSSLAADNVEMAQFNVVWGFVKWENIAGLIADKIRPH